MIWSDSSTIFGLLFCCLNYAYGNLFNFERRESSALLRLRLARDQFVVPDTISGRRCQTLMDCKNEADKFPSTEHKCSAEICVRFYVPGQYGCNEDRQCNITCRESHCAMDESIGEKQCICNVDAETGRPMLLYANKCWKECPNGGLLSKYLIPEQVGNLWICRDITNGFATRYEAATRTKRQSRFFC